MGNTKKTIGKKSSGIQGRGRITDNQRDEQFRDKEEYRGNRQFRGRENYNGNRSGYQGRGSRGSSSYWPPPLYQAKSDAPTLGGTETVTDGDKATSKDTTKEDQGLPIMGT
ncbi:unnamed protein product [Cochlearia groenlandica]